MKTETYKITSSTSNLRSVVSYGILSTTSLMQHFNRGSLIRVNDQIEKKKLIFSAGRINTSLKSITSSVANVNDGKLFHGDYSTSDALDILQSTWIVKRSVPSYHLSCNFDSTTTGFIDRIVFELVLKRSVRVYDINRIVYARIGKYMT